MMEEMEYLRLPSVFAKQIQHPEDYIKKNDPKDPQRRIFKNVPIGQEERKQIQLLKEHLQMHKIDINPEQYQNIYRSQTDEVLLRYLYACQLNLDQTKELLRGHLAWLREPKNYEFDQDVLDVYVVFNLFKNKGIVYLLGRDKQYRPTLIVNCEQINTIQPDLLMRAINILCIIMEDYCFYDGKVENWNIIIDLKEKCVLNVKLQDYYTIFLQLQQNFPCTVDKIFVLHPSMSVQLGWGEFMEHVSNKKKIIIVSDYNQFKKYYEPTQMERKYGGRVEIKKYFPPLNTLPEGKQLTEPLKVMESITQMALLPQTQSVLPNNFEQSQKTLLQPQETMKIAKSKIDRDFSVYPQQEVNDFTIYRPTEIAKEPIRNISKYNRLTQAQQLKEEYEYQLQQELLQQKQSEIMKTKKIRQSQYQYHNNNDDFEEVLSEQIVTQTYKPGQPTAKSRLTADQVEEDNAACKIF